MDCTVSAPTQPISSASAALPQPVRRSRRTNNPLAGIDTNTARGRRVADLVRAYLKALGNPTETGRQAEVIAAAELQVLAEETRSAALQSPATADLDNLVRLQAIADRALKRLGIKAQVEKPETLREYVARRAAEKAAL